VLLILRVRSQQSDHGALRLRAREAYALISDLDDHEILISPASARTVSRRAARLLGISPTALAAQTGPNELNRHGRMGGHALAAPPLMGISPAYASGPD
jgi:hypothetical protein